MVADNDGIVSITIKAPRDLSFMVGCFSGNLVVLDSNLIHCSNGILKVKNGYGASSVGTNQWSSHWSLNAFSIIQGIDND